MQEARREGNAERDRERQIEQVRRELEKNAEARRKAIEKASLAMIKDMFKRAKEADKAENWAAAYSHYTDVTGSRNPGAREMVTQSKTRLHEIDGMAEERMRQARRHELYGQYAEAVALYRDVANEFQNSKHYAAANKRMAYLRRASDSAPALILAEAEELDKAKEYLRAKIIYKQVVSRYPRSLEAMKARKRIEQFNQDIVISKALTESLEKEAALKAPVWMNMSDNFLKNKMPERARQYLDMIVEKYPTTEWADKARKKLEELE
jgi:TolA-binding protein